MGSTLHLVRRGAVYYFRRAVPEHLLAKVGRTEVSASLRTVHRREATIRCRQISTSLDVYFQRLCMAKGPTTEEIDAQIKSFFQRALNWSMEYTEVLMDDQSLDAETEAAGMPRLIEHYQRQLKAGQFDSVVQSDAVDLLAPILPSGEKADVGTFKHACRGIALAKIEQYRRLIGDLTGEPMPSTHDPRFVGMSANGYPPHHHEEVRDQQETLQSIANRYRNHRKGIGDADKTLADFDISMRLASEVISPAKPIQAMSDADIRALRDLIDAIPPNALKSKSAEGKTFRELAESNENGPRLSYKTREKRLWFFRAMLNWASDEGYISTVPGKKISVGGKKDKGKTVDPYEKSDLERIFSTPVYTGRISLARPGTAGDQVFKDGRFWVPLIALYSGMRLGEIVQLHRNDVRQIDGVWDFDINRAEDDDKKVKTETSLRKVPVHKVLIDLGLSARCHDAKLGKRLFPDLPAAQNGYYSHNFSKWWGRYGETFGFRTTRKVFHSFRHLFADALRDLEAPEYVLKSIMGHADSSTTNKYGLGVGLDVRRSYVDNVEFDIVALRLLIERESV